MMNWNKAGLFKNHDQFGNNLFIEDRDEAVWNPPNLKTK